MAAFIVISANNRLHYLVDGIEKCRPLNPNVVTDISTGIIIKSDNGSYTYEYKIHGEGNKDGIAKSLNVLLSNQLAAFRLAHSIPKDQLVNIFFLENPLSETDYEESESWIEEFDKVYDNGKGSDTAFCLYRIIFSYCHDRPSDVCSQINRQVLQQIIKQHRNNQSDGDKFQRYIFYVDNQKSDAAATCLSKEDHDLKMPRFLLDFMMLTSNHQDAYSILNSINGQTNNIKFFSVGFGESMYYFPDVVEYYCHADKRDLYSKYINDEDETGDDISKRAMDVEKFPFGLKKRVSRLGKIYGDVLFNVNIDSFKNTADWIIDNKIVELKEYIDKEREQESEAFLNSEEIIRRKERITQLGHDVNLIEKADDESEEDFKKRLSEFKLMEETEEKELQRIIEEFEPECPYFIDRKTIYTDLCVIKNEEENEEKTNKLRHHYINLLNFVLSEKFLKFVREQKAKDESLSTPKEVEKDPLSTGYGHNNNPGCLGRLMFWKKSETLISTPQEEVAPIPIKQNPVDSIIKISEQKKLKDSYKKFKLEVNSVQNIFEKEKIFCENFKLKSHTNHYFPLICLEKLREQQIIDFNSRIVDIIKEWREKDSATKTMLDSLNSERSNSYTKKYSFIDWVDPFPFIETLSISRLPIICNELQKKAAPFVNYNLTQGLKENRIVRALFSDRPSFKEEFTQMKSKLNNGNEISVFISSHIASKICFMEFLPMDDDVVNNLVDLQEGDNVDGFETILSEAKQIPTKTLEETETEGYEPPVEFWGEHGG